MKKLRLKDHVTWSVINLRTGSDDLEPGYKAVLLLLRNVGTVLGT